MNLVLFRPEDLATPLPAKDPRVLHVLNVLRRRSGEPFDAAMENGPTGKASFGPPEPGGCVRVMFSPMAPCPPPEPGVLVCALCRPQTVRKIVREVAVLGIGALHFFPAERGEPSYASASLWTDGELDRLLREAAQQAFNPRLPNLAVFPDLISAVGAIPPGLRRLALDNYASEGPLQTALPAEGGAALVLGPERGWTNAEREKLRATGHQLRDLGHRVLRAETAAVAGVVLLRAAAGCLSQGRGA